MTASRGPTRRATLGIIAAAATIGSTTRLRAQAAKVPLTVWYPGAQANEITGLKKVLASFHEANPGIDVKMEFIDWSQISPKLNTAFASGTVPDVFGHGVAAAASFVANDRVLALDPFLEKLDPATRADYADTLGLARMNDRVYILPLSREGRLYAYRADLFAAAGLKPDAPIRSLAELRAAAQALTERSGGRINRSGLIVPTWAISRQQAFATLLGQHGGALLSADGRKVVWNGAEGVAALTFMVDIYNGDNAVGTGLGDPFGNAPPAQHPLVLGRAAIALALNSEVARMQDLPGMAQKIRVLPPFGAKAGDPPASWGGAGPGLFISKASPHPDAAWAFISYMMQPDVLMMLSMVTGSIPARASLANNPQLQGRPAIASFVAAAPAFKPNPNIPEWVRVREVLDRAIEKAVYGRLAPAAALDEAADEAQKLLNA